MKAEEKFLINVGLVTLIIIIWVPWQRNGQSNHNGEAADQTNLWSGRNTLERIL
jgi:hypothetical protein